MAVAAAVRHDFTSYDELPLGGHDRNDARAQIRDRVEEVLDAWRARAARGKGSGSTRPAGRRVTEQLCFSFDGAEPQSVSGVELWRERRRIQISELAGITGLPIGQAVRVTLISGPVVQGILLLDEEGLWVDGKRSGSLRLRVGRVDFLAGDVDSCVRLD